MISPLHFRSSSLELKKPISSGENLVRTTAREVLFSSFASRALCASESSFVCEVVQDGTHGVIDLDSV